MGRLRFLRIWQSLDRKLWWGWGGLEASEEWSDWSEKICEKGAEKARKKLRITRTVVKNFTQAGLWLVKRLGFGNVLWEKSGKIYTKNLFNYIFPVDSFAGFTQTSTTMINLKRII